jgi:hypothetical protein
VTDDEKEMVCRIFEKEGIEYGLTNYTDFKKHHTVKDPKFHEIHARFIAARDEMIEYVGYDKY